jgi:hypothetical protein
MLYIRERGASQHTTNDPRTQEVQLMVEHYMSTGVKVNSKTAKYLRTLNA